ncbi:MAG TPA: DUF3017 domain-containing protein [Jatrophihabitans sp.]|jgi:hypothetical protein|uniref:DUF3017 domain-containing protein n=1 Tax=Jatrophihabitans sp. TaxID=1932789 RepID=UPI002F15CE8F
MASSFSSRDLKEIPFGVVLLIELIAVLSISVFPQHWLRAVGGMVFGVLVAGFFRLTLTDQQAGLLRVRRRSFDVTCYWTLAVLTAVVALLLPR